MAKELPYFKFEPNQWENGNIQMCSRDDKGLFIDTCSMYWSRLGDLPLKLAIQKLCAGNATAYDSLCEEKIIEVIDGNIFIKFLSEQLEEFGDVSKKNSKNAKEGWEKRRKQKDLSERNATALKSQSENDAIREDKIKEEEIIKIDNNDPLVIKHNSYSKQCLDQPTWIETIEMQKVVLKGKTEIALKNFNLHLISQSENKTTLKDYKSHFVNWMNKRNQQKATESNNDPKKLLF